MNIFDYSVWGDWAPDTQAPAQIGQSGVRTLDALSKLGPEFSDWSVVDASETYIPLEKARNQVGQLVEDNVSRDDDGSPWLIGGYNVWASRLDPPKTPMARSFTLKVRAGSPSEYRISLQAGDFEVPPGLVSEPGPGDGLLISAVTERFDPTRPDHFRRSNMLAELMIDRVSSGVRRAHPAPPLAVIDGRYVDLGALPTDEPH